MVLNFALAGRSRIDGAFNTLRHNPAYAVGLVVGAFAAVVMSAVWGGLHTWAGWHRMRARLLDEGFVALGEVLAPDGGLHDYRDGIWRGLWRVHGACLGFAILQAPIIALVLIPWEVTQALFVPVASAYGQHPDMAQFVGMGIPAFFLVSALAIVLAQHLIAFRLLGQIQSPYKLGTLFVVTGESWRRTLNYGQTVVSLAILAGLGAGLGHVFSMVNVWMGEAAHLHFPDTLGLWVYFAVALVFGALFLEALGALSTEEDATVSTPVEPYSFTSWLTAWLSDVIAWLLDRGLTIIGVAAVFGVGLTVAKDTIMTGAAFDDGSWGGLGWFVAAALILLHMRRQGGDS
jgi:hypothetical protein